MAAAHLANCDELPKNSPINGILISAKTGANCRAAKDSEFQSPEHFERRTDYTLDEATASLDVENETAIQTALSRLIRNKTVLVIAHRMRTVAGADKIVVLSDGVVAEQGTPEKLLNKNGIFKENG